MYKVKKVKSKKTVSIVVPLHNKESNIESTISLIIKSILFKEIQLIVVENDSSDNSKKIAIETINKYKQQFDVSLYESKKGLGNALIEGLKHCKHEWIYIVPADFSFGTSDIAYVEKNKLWDNFDLFIGSKGHKESQINRTISRKMYSKIFNILLRVNFGIPFKDTQGTIIFKKNILDQINKLENEEFLVTTELIVKAFKKNKKISEIPVKELATETQSTVKPFKDGIKMLINIFSLKRNS